MGTKHLTEADRLRARMLFFDSGLAKSRICQLTGFSLNQVKLAIREKTPKSRCGRPPRRRAGVLPAPTSTGAVSGGMNTGAMGTGYMPEHEHSGMVHMGGMPSAGSDGSLGHASGTMPEATGMEAGSVSSHAPHTSSLHHPQQHHHHHIQPHHHQHHHQQQQQHHHQQQQHHHQQHHPQQPLPQLHHQHHHHHQEQQQHQHQHHQHHQHHQPHHQHAHQDHHQSASIRHKWEPEYSPTSVYAWTSHPAQPSTPSTVSSVSTHYGHYGGRALSPPAPTHASAPGSGPSPLAGSLRAPSSSSSSSSLLGIHSLAGYDRPYADGHSSGGSSSSPHGLSSMSSNMSTSSLASSATSYSSMSPSPSGISTSSVGVHGGFSLPAILTTAARP